MKYQYSELDFDDCTATADECEGAMDDTELNRTRLVEKFVTHANFRAAVAVQFDNEWIANLIGEPVHSWAIDFVGIELGNLAS